MRISDAILAACLLSLCSCTNRPAPPARPRVSPSQAAADAMSLYDANHDGVLDSAELDKSPLGGVRFLIDQDKSGTITAEEIAAAVRILQQSHTIMLPASPTFIYKGAPLEGASITLEPVSFLGADYHAMTAVTDAKGKATFIGSDRRYPGVYVGLYQVRVSKIKDGKELIPARYNTSTELSLLVAQEQWAYAVFMTFLLDP
jgi:EF hand